MHYFLRLTGLQFVISTIYKYAEKIEEKNAYNFLTLLLCLYKVSNHKATKFTTLLLYTSNASHIGMRLSIFSI